MIETTGQSITFYAFFTAAKQGKTALTVTVNVFRGTATVITAGAAVEVGDGLYRYTLASGSTAAAESYAAVFKTTDATVDAQHVPSLWVVGQAWPSRLAPIQVQTDQLAFTAGRVNANAQVVTVASGTVAGSSQVPIGLDLVIGTTNYWQARFLAGGSDSTGWTQFVFAVKRDADADQDSEALVLARVTNPASAGTDGLLTLNGQPAADRTLATVAVTGTTPDTAVTVTLAAGALVIPPSTAAPYRYELTRWVGSRKERIGMGQLTVERTVVRATAAP